MLSALELTLVLLSAAVIAVVALRALGLPPLVAYLAVGVVLGPHAADLAANTEAVHGLAEIGVVFLMFSLGLEFSLPKLMTLRQHVFGLGAAQVGSTLVLTVLALLVLPAFAGKWLFPGGIDWRGALALGGAVAMSSTALVIKLLSERRELETEHGKRVFSVLLFQDLAVIPLLILIPALSGGDDWWRGMLLAVVKATILLVLLLRFGPPLMRSWFNMVARQRSHELFTLNVLLATLFFAWLTKMAGLSMELGAFVAGMLIAETEFRYQVEEDIKPYRDVLLGLFFITIGMQLNLRVVLESWEQVLLLLTLPVVAKFFLVAALVRGFGGTPGVAVRTGIWLAQAGEFGFVLLTQALGASLLGNEAVQPALAAMLLSLMLSPLLIAQANRIALRTTAQEWLQRSLQIQKIATASLARSKHVLIAGYGRSGQGLAHVLEAEKVPYVALDLDSDRVREAAAAGESVVYADATRRDALVAAGVHRARALVITFGEVPDSLKLLAVVGDLAPQLPVLVRAASESDIERLRSAGATEVVPEIAEGSLMLASHALALAGIPAGKVMQRLSTVRHERYAILRGFFHGADDHEHESIEQEHLHLHAVGLLADSAAIGRAIGDINLEGARITAVVRAQGRLLAPPPELVLAVGDTVVLSGTVDQVGAAEAGLLGGG